MTTRNSEPSSPQTVETMIDELGQELLAQGFALIERMKKTKKTEDEKMEITAEKDRQTEMMKQFKTLQGVYSSLVKLNRYDGSGRKAKNDEFDRAVLDKIKDKKSALGGIVQSIQ